MQIKKALNQRFGSNDFYENTEFKFKEDEEGKLICYVICYTCGDSIKTTNTNGWSLGNLYRHIQQKHKDVPSTSSRENCSLKKWFSKGSSTGKSSENVEDFESNSKEDELRGQKTTNDIECLEEFEGFESNPRDNLVEDVFELEENDNGK